MAENKQMDLDPDPSSTHAASEEYKAAWWAKYGKQSSQKADASEADSEPEEDPAQGSGEGPEGNRPNDPAKRTARKR